MKKKILGFTLTAISILGAPTYLRSATLDADSSQSISGTIHFRLNESLLEPDYNGNRVVLDSIISTLSTSVNTPSEIRITGWASPEGSASYNLNLSKRRAISVFDFLNRHAEVSDVPTKEFYLGRDWSGLLEYVNEDTGVPDRDEVLELLSGLSEGIDNGPTRPGDDGMTRLRAIGNGKAYHYLYDRYFSPLRSAQVSIKFPSIPQLRELEPGEITCMTSANTPTPLFITERIYTGSPEKPFYMALKTNVLLDATLIPSIGAEFYVGRNISLGANWAYGWWDKNSTHRYWRYYGGDLTVRYWFGKAAHSKPLTGHHVGIYGGIFTFDFELGGKGYMGGRPGRSLWDRSLANIGVEYGYSLPVARRLNIDFTFGVGYNGGHVVKYHPDGNKYIWDSLKRITWIGPTKAEISLVWLIGRGNYNTK